MPNALASKHTRLQSTAYNSQLLCQALAEEIKAICMLHHKRREDALKSIAVCHKSLL